MPEVTRLSPELSRSVSAHARLLEIAADGNRVYREGLPSERVRAIMSQPSIRTLSRSTR